MCSFVKYNPKYQLPIKLSCNFSIRSYAQVKFYKRYLDFSTKKSNLRVNHLITMVTFLLAVSNELNKKNRVFGNICLSGKVEMIDFNPSPFVVLSSQEGCVN